MSQSICKTCGKSRPENKRAGSFSSFLFQELRCSCPGSASAKSPAQIARNTTATRVAQRRQFTNSRLKRKTSTGNSSSADCDQTVFQRGDIIGGFAVKDEIGFGGMGIVYLVEHPGLHRQFALKVLAPELVNEQSWLRFQGEAKTMASLNHRTFVKVFDLGIHARAVPFYSMDYLQGRTLETILVEDGPLPLKETLDVFIEVLDGLAYAHRNGIIHRDIKPGNIMLCTTDGVQQVKILDFGISKFIGADASKIQSLTAAGDIFGSPYYMSPEQCSGETVDSRSDIYSLGCSLFEVLSGFVPFEGKNSVETVTMHQEDEPPKLSQVVPEIDLPPSIDLVISKCLAKKPQNRYQSAKELSIDLLRLKEGKNLLAYSDSSLASESEVLSSKKMVIVSALAVAVALSLTIAIALAVQSSAVKGIAHKTPKPATILPSNSTTIDNTEIFESRIAAQETTISVQKTADIKKLLTTRTEPYSNTAIVNGRKVTVFNFPNTFSIGHLGYSDPNTNKWSRTDAQGVVVTTFNTRVHINGDDELQLFPSLLKYFRPDQLDWVRLDYSPVKPSEFLPLLLKQKCLFGLELKHTNLTDSDLLLLEKLPSLNSLDAGNTLVTGKALAKCNFLTKLKSLHVSCLKDARPTILALVKVNRIEEIDLNKVKLTHEDYSLIARLTKLRSLSLKESLLEDSDLETLSSLPNLEVLYLDGDFKLTSAATKSLMKFKALKRLNPPDQIEDRVNEKTLRQALPGIQII